MMNAKSPDALRVLKDIRDYVLLLSVGNACLCEKPFLIKFGEAIEGHMVSLRDAILALKRTFPGKFTHEINTDDVLDRLQNAVLRLKAPDEKLTAECTVGELGRELEAVVNELNRAIKAIHGQVEGTSASYSRTDSAIGFFRKFGFMGRWVVFVPKMIGIAALVVGCIFLGLLVTMERGGELRKRAASDEETLRVTRVNLSEMAKEKKALNEKIDALRTDEMSREAKIEVLQLILKVRDVDIRMRGVEMEIATLESRIRESQKKIAELQAKPFLKRLLRQ